VYIEVMSQRNTFLQKVINPKFLYCIVTTFVCYISSW